MQRQKLDGYIYIGRNAEDKPGNLPSVISAIKKATVFEGCGIGIELVLSAKTE